MKNPSLRLEEAKKLLENYKQSQLLAYYEKLSDEERESLLNDILSCDFDLMDKLYRQSDTERSSKDLDLKPARGQAKKDFDKETLDKLYKIGKEEIARGRVCAITMAGGQGSRLGHKGPKGSYDIGLKSRRSLFEIQADGLKALGKIPWYIMTSDTNHLETISFFKENKYFSYPKEDIIFFSQSMMPVMDLDGKLLLESPSKLLKSPNGNGGLFSSLKDNDLFSDMKKRNIKWLFVCGIDNVLVKMADPYFIGFTLYNDYHASAKSFLKRDAGEKAGVFCYKDGKPYVIEYTEIPDDLAKLKDQEGTFVYGDTNVLNYVFDIDIVKKIADSGLPYHKQIKAVTAYIDGKYISSREPDSYKYETFLFDSFNMLDGIGIFRIERIEEFAPVKNKTGIDSAQSAREMYINIYGEDS